MATPVGRSTLGGRQVRVIILAIVGLLLLAYSGYRVGKIFDVFASRYELVTLVTSGLGLREGAPVTLAGQRIGQVKEIAFIPIERKTDDHNLAIILAINEDVRDQIRADSRALLRTQGLLGDKFVDIAPGSAAAAILQPGDTMASEQSIDVDQFLAEASVTLDAANGIVADLRAVTSAVATGEGTLGRFVMDESLYSQMLSATSRLEGTLSMLNDADGTFGRLLRDPALYNRLNSAVARVDSLGAAVLDGRGSLGRLVSSDSLYDSLLGAARGAESTMTGLTDFVTDINASDGSLRRLMADPALYDQFLKAVVDLQSLITAIRENPDRFKPNIRVDIF
jgi:phospholipid/cholesterol/gamma-HCH transport system substrate-binding protein